MSETFVYLLSGSVGIIKREDEKELVEYRDMCFEYRSSVFPVAENYNPATFQYLCGVFLNLAKDEFLRNGVSLDTLQDPSNLVDVFSFGYSKKPL